MIEQKLKTTGKYPQKVAFSLWGGEFIRTQGVNIGEIFYLLGVEPIWDSRGRVQDVRLIPMSELKRPRIDVVIQTSGQFRGAATSRMKLIDKAMEIVGSFENGIDTLIVGGWCPGAFGLVDENQPTQKHECLGEAINMQKCHDCWCRECSENPDVEEKNTEPMIMDSGERREFSSGAVRDIAEGKGRCDLLPLDVAGDLTEESGVLRHLYGYVRQPDEGYLEMALGQFVCIRGWDTHTMLLEVSIHMEEGAKKYGERNWEKGIPAHCYIDSAVRHYLKWRRGDTDERHDRAFCWKILCLMWTMRHHPECNDLPKEEDQPNA